MEPNNPEIEKRINIEVDKMAKVGITLPTILKTEKETNPFFRLQSKELVARVEELSGNKISSELECFTLLRALKDKF